MYFFFGMFASVPCAGDLADVPADNFNFIDRRPAAKRPELRGWQSGRGVIVDLNGISVQTGTSDPKPCCYDRTLFAADLTFSARSPRSISWASL